MALRDIYQPLFWIKVGSWAATSNHLPDDACSPTLRRGELVKEPVVTMDDLYAKESGHLSLAGSSSTVERLHELKIKMAVEAYESSD